MSGRRHELPLGKLLYEIDRREPPLLEIDSGDEVVVETEDAFTGQIRQPGDRRDRKAMPRSNPVSGPIFVNGAGPGDALRIDIRAIEPLIGQCSTYLWPYDYLQAGLGGEPEDQTRICPIEDGQIRWSESLSIPYEPMIGVIATAPDWGVPTTAPPGDHGGNLDLKEVGPGCDHLASRFGARRPALRRRLPCRAGRRRAQRRRPRDAGPRDASASPWTSRRSCRARG